VKIIRTKIPDVIIFEPAVFGDDRGFFMETFRQSWFDDLGIRPSFVQSNHSKSAKGVLRGLHFQEKNPQGKLIRVTSGEAFDVAVVIRTGSKTFGEHVSVTLSEENKRILWIPPGFAHGFLVTSEVAELHYQCTDYYNPDYEKSIAWNDPNINIQWPLGDNLPRLSTKDSNGISL